MWCDPLLLHNLFQQPLNLEPRNTNFIPVNPTLSPRRAGGGAAPPALRHLLQQVLVLVEMLEEGRLTDELVLLTCLLAGLPGLSKFYLQGTQGRPHHLPVAEVLE